MLIYRLQVQRVVSDSRDIRFQKSREKRFLSPCSTIQSENEIATRANPCLSDTPITLQSVKIEWDLRKSLVENEDYIIHHFTQGRDFLFLCLLFDCCCCSSSSSSSCSCCCSCSCCLIVVVVVVVVVEFCCFLLSKMISTSLLPAFLRPLQIMLHRH